MTSPMQKALRGIVPPMVTPLTHNRNLDLPALERLIERMLAGGVHGLFALGTTGEATAISPAQRRELIDHTCAIVRGRVPVWVGVTDTCLDESLQLARHAEIAGAAGIVVSAPYYLPPDQAELVQYVTAFAYRQSLPIILYNIPVLTKVQYELPTVRQLSDLHRVVGIKDSSGSITYLRQLLTNVTRSDWSTMVGMEASLAAGVTLGADGGVPAGANLAPRLFVDLYSAAAAGDIPRTNLLQPRIIQLQRIYTLGNGIPAILRGLKCALALVNVCGEHMAPPLASCTPDQRQSVRTILSELGLLQ